MPSLNEVAIMGHLGQDPELKTTNSGTSVVNMSVATTYRPRDKDPETEWHRVVVWSKQAENCHRFLGKGSLVYVKGRLQTRSWEKDGVKRYTTEIVAFQVLFLDRKGDRAAPTPAPAESSNSGSWRDNPDEDLPF